MQTSPHNDQRSLFFSNQIACLCLFIVLITLYRAWVLVSMSDLSLHFDEAQYWLWSKDLQWGYYSKPPFLALVIHFFTHFLGDTEPAIRSISLFFYPLTTLAIFTMALKITQNTNTALWSGIIFISMPGVSLSSVLITTDVVLFLWWSLSCCCFYLAVNENKNWQWLGVGIFAGFGLLTKYSMVIFALAAFAWIITVPNLRIQLKNPKLWVAGLLSLLIFAPNLYWNWQNDWPNIRHTTELSSEGVSGLHPMTALNFLAEQFGVFGLVSFAGFILWIFTTFIHKKQKPDQAQWFLLYFSLTFLLIITLQALKGRAYANWAAPTYAIASIATACWIGRRQYLKIALLGTNLLLMVLVYHGDGIYDWIKPDATKGPDPLKTLRAWHDWRDQIKEALQQCDSCSIIVDSRESAAQLAYQLRDENPPLLYWNPDFSQNNHYEMVYSLKNPQQGRFLLILEKPVSPETTDSFDKIEAIKQFHRKGKYKNIRSYNLLQADNFKGYSQ